MAELLRFRTRDGRYLSGGWEGAEGGAREAGGALHVVGGEPSHLETFVPVEGSALPLGDGGQIALAVCDQSWEPTGKLFLIISHFELLPNGVQKVVFGGPETDVWCESWGIYPPTSTHWLWRNLFTVEMNPHGELSFRVIDRNVWYLRIDNDAIVLADGAAPFQDDTTFIIEHGPFDCAAVTGQIIDDITRNALPGARITADGGYSGTADASGNFFLANAGASTPACVPAGALTVVVTEDRHLSMSETLTVPASGSVSAQIALTCREIRGDVTDESGLPLSDYSVTLTGPAGSGSPEEFVPDPNSGEFVFRCVRQGDYKLAYPGAEDVSLSVGANNPPYVHLEVGTASITGHVLDDQSGQGLPGARVRMVTGVAPLPLPATSGPPPAAGRYQLTGVRAGSPLVRATLDGYAQADATVVVPSGQTVIQDFRLVREAPARAAVFNTGVDATGAVLSGGAMDPHWQVVAGPGISSAQPAFVVQNQHPFGMYFASTDSAWIWVNNDGSGAVGGDYTFRLEFSVAAKTTGTRISGGWGCDNNGRIFLNGKPPAGTGVFSLIGGGPGTSRP
ncbi:hypothetical protein ETD83_31690 [Actinomadura soli]|uniref:Carboxypeptidase regulatory-like domain-containing protein n=1 Tax=Actinomadura soli TaxID=2508997 RepID=A0A5C4J3J4_9ACTN|nr:carboxypeptidase regulatory-like domain-containing protein [Actinomadura soli]TMQ91267.1 hypothetical protein ETD83_31690 [Actinomadura soli]